MIGSTRSTMRLHAMVSPAVAVIAMAAYKATRQTGTAHSTTVHSETGHTPAVLRERAAPYGTALSRPQNGHLSPAARGTRSRHDP